MPFYLVRHGIVAAQSFRLGAQRTENLPPGHALLPHRHADVVAPGIGAYREIRTDVFVRPHHLLVVYIGISIQVCSGETQFLRRREVQRTAVDRRHAHRLPQVMVEIIVHLVTAFMLPASEYVHIITAAVRIHDAQQACLVGLRLRFTEVCLGITDSPEVILRCQVPFFGRRRAGITVQQFEPMVALHHGIRRNAVHTNRIVTGELAVILQIGQTGIQGLPDARVRPQRQPLPIELHRQAIGMLMVAFAAVQRIHQAPPGIHAVALHQPTDLRHIKSRTDIRFYVTGRNRRVYRQILLRIEVHQVPAAPGTVLRRSEVRFEATQHGREPFLLPPLAIPPGILHHAAEVARTQRTGMRIPESYNLTVGKAVLRSGGHGFFYHRDFAGQVAPKVLVEQQDKIRIIIDHVATVSRAFVPDSRSCIETVIGQSLQSPLPQGAVLCHDIEIIFPSLSVFVSFIFVQHQRDGKDKTCLDDIPIIMRHTVPDDHVGHFLQRTGINGHAVRIMPFHIGIKEVVAFGKEGHDAFMDDFKRCHADQRLLVAMVQVPGQVAVINPLQISIKHFCRHPAILLFSRQPPQVGRIACMTHDVYVAAFYLRAYFLGPYPFQRLTRQITVFHVNALCLVGIRQTFFYSRTGVRRGGSPCTAEHDRRHRCLFFSHMAEPFTTDIHVLGLCFPIHIKPRTQIVFPTLRILVHILPQGFHDLARPILFLYQFQSSGLLRRSRYDTRMPCLSPIRDRGGRHYGKFRPEAHGHEHKPIFSHKFHL